MKHRVISFPWFVRELSFFKTNVFIQFGRRQSDTPSRHRQRKMLPKNVFSKKESPSVTTDACNTTAERRSIPTPDKIR